MKGEIGRENEKGRENVRGKRERKKGKLGGVKKGRET